MLIQRARLWTRFFLRASYPRDLPLLAQAFARRRRFEVPPEIWRTIEPLSGFLSAKEAGLLYWAARQCAGISPVIELGAFEGKSTILFARSGCHVHSIDAWTLDIADRSAYGILAVSAEASFERFQHNLRQAGVDELVTIHRGLTHVIGRGWKLPTRLLFVDAGHTYEDVKDDLNLWAAHVESGGLLLMHDVLGDRFLGVTRAASELLREGWRVVASAGSVVAFTRRQNV